VNLATVLSPSGMKKMKAAAYDAALAAMVDAGIEIQKVRKILAGQKAAGKPYMAALA
jgi:hypothetical protein